MAYSYPSYFGNVSTGYPENYTNALPHPVPNREINQTNEVSCTIKLKNEELWKQFHELETEMIITKTGRRMFPSLIVEVAGLEPHVHYCVFLHLVPVSGCRYKFTANSGWSPVGTEEVPSGRLIYVHPESPATGAHWNTQGISFARMKMTNSRHAASDVLVLNSMHKYQPYVVICKTADVQQLEWAPKRAIAFSETQFIAVTAYQNAKITGLKIENNPFAKGFRENGKLRTRKKRDSEDKSDDERSNDSMESEEIREQTRFPAIGTEPSRHVLPPHYFYPHPYYYYNLPFYYPPVIIPRPEIKEETPEKKFTDFSIKAITGMP